MSRIYSKKERKRRQKQFEKQERKRNRGKPKKGALRNPDRTENKTFDWNHKG